MQRHVHCLSKKVKVLSPLVVYLSPLPLFFLSPPLPPLSLARGSVAACVCLSTTLGRLCDVRPSSRHHSDRAASRATSLLPLLSPYLPSLCPFVDGSHLRRRVSVSWEYIYTLRGVAREAGRQERRERSDGCLFMWLVTRLATRGCFWLPHSSLPQFNFFHDYIFILKHFSREI